MSDPTERVAQCVIEARRARFTPECRYPFADAKCGYDRVAAMTGGVIGEDDHTVETCREHFDSRARFGGFPVIPIPLI